jgi:hypothetical protein
VCDRILEKNCEEQEEADDEREKVNQQDDNKERAGADDAQMVEPECEEPGRQVDYVAEEVARRMRAREDLSYIAMMMQIGKTDVWRKAQVTSVRSLDSWGFCFLTIMTRVADLLVCNDCALNYRGRRENW